MDERVLHLEDGSTVTAKVNFGTIYYMEQINLFPLLRRANKLKKKGKQPTSRDAVQLAAKMIYVLLRSNGRNVDLDEALVLTPIDIDEGSEFYAVFEDFNRKLENFQKKQQARQAMKMQARKMSA